MAFDSTLSGPNANSNLSIERAEALVGDLPQSDGIIAWLGLDDSQKGKTLTAATLALDSQEWRGHKCRCEQNLSFPRLIENCSGCDNAYCNKMPYKIELATAYLAVYLGPSGGFTGIAENDSIGALGVDGLDPFAEVQVGPLRVKMKEQSTSDKSLASLTGSLPPFVAELIRPYLGGGMDGEILMESPSVARFQRRRNVGSNYTGFYDIGDTIRPRRGSWF